MKRKQKEEFKSKSVLELLSEVQKKQKDLSLLKINILMAKEKNTSSLKRKKDELAIILTILNEKKYLERNTPKTKEDNK